MGTKFREIVEKREISIELLKNRKLVFDTYNLIYQFLSNIRLMDGTLLMDSKGRVTSHLIGIISRITPLIEKGIKPAFVFDGKAPDLKKQERERRKTIKLEAQKKAEKAEREGDVKEMKKYASMTSVLTKEMVEDAKKLLDLMGLPVIQAESEGEAQMAYMIKKGDAYAGVSQDYDSLMFGVPLLVRNLTITGKKKQSGKLNFIQIKPEIIELKATLEKLKITREQLIVVGILSGTDYNKEGIKGIGPKKALKIIQGKTAEKEFAKIFEELEWEKNSETDWKEIYHAIKDMPVTDNYTLEWKPADREGLKKFMQEREFSEERIENFLSKISTTNETKKQKELSSFFGK